MLVFKWYLITGYVWAFCAWFYHIDGWWLFALFLFIYCVSIVLYVIRNKIIKSKRYLVEQHGEYLQEVLTRRHCAKCEYNYPTKDYETPLRVYSRVSDKYALYTWGCHNCRASQCKCAHNISDFIRNEVVDVLKRDGENYTIDTDKPLYYVIQYDELLHHSTRLTEYKLFLANR